MGGFSQTTFGFFNTGGGSVTPTTPPIVVVGAGADSTVRCGLSNNASGGRATVFGYFNTASGVDSAIYGGLCHTAAGNFSFIGGGNINNAANVFATVVGGQFNTACHRGSFIGGGINNVVTTSANNTYSGSVVAGGVGNNTTGGTYNGSLGCFTSAPTVCQTGEYSFIGGGFQNLAKGNLSVIVGGCRNISCATNSIIGGGWLNTASAEYSFIGGGYQNTVCLTAAYGAVLAGCQSTVCHACSYVVGRGIATDEANTSFFNNIKTGGARYGYAEKTTNYTLTQTDYAINVTSGAATITLPTAVGITGKVYVIKNTSGSSITVNTTSAQTIDGAATQTVSNLSALMIMSNNVNWIVI